MKRRIYSEKVDLIEKSREAMLSAVQVFNNPLTMFKTETFIVLSSIAWVYLLHAYYRKSGKEYRYSTGSGVRKRFIRNPDGSVKYWDLEKCVSNGDCPLDSDTVNNLKFLIGLRNQIEHKKASGLDSYLSARYQACALNFNYYLKKLHGNKYALDNNLALSLQFAELDYYQAKLIKDKEELIPKEVTSFVAEFDSKLSINEIKSERYAYRLLFHKVFAKRRGQADRVIEFLDPKSRLAKKISKEYWVTNERKSPPMLARQVIDELKKKGIKIDTTIHTSLWKKYDGKNTTKGFGVMVGSSWLWYKDWVDFLTSILEAEK